MTQNSTPTDPPLTPRQKLSWGLFGGSSTITVGLAFETGVRPGLIALAAAMLLAAGALGFAGLRSASSGGR